MHGGAVCLRFLGCVFGRDKDFWTFGLDRVYVLGKVWGLGRDALGGV